MVIGHTHNFMTAPIYLFHVAGFMTLSGYTTSNREKYTIFIGRKVLSLVVPFLLINVIFIGIAHFINKQVKQDAFISIPSIQDFLINLNTVDIAGATWFLVVLFYATIIVGGIVRFAKSNFALNIILIVSLVLAIVVQEFDIRYTRHLDLTALATFFLLLGNFVKRYKLLPKHFSLGIGHLVSVFVIIFSVKIYYLGMDWPSRTFNLPANLLTVCSGMYLAYAIALIATKNKTTSNILQTIGRRTIPILFFSSLRI
jgi:fucose 4-O-acetylase-like acetyltransferase